MRSREWTLSGLVLLAAVLLAGCDLLMQADPGALKASGVVEVLEISVSAEMGGRVAEVHVEEGDVVSEGQPLFRLDPEDLELRRQQVMASGDAAVAEAELALLQARQELEDLQENWPLRAAQHQLELAQARDELQTAENRRIWNQKNNRATEDTIEYYEAQLVLAEREASEARKDYNRHEDESEHDPDRAQARVALEQAEDQRNEITRILNWYKGEPTDIDQALLDGNVAIARARVDEASQEYEKWKEGPDPDAVALAQAYIRNAEALLKLARVQAETELHAIELRLEESIVVAPSDGVILTQSVERGEVISPGVTLMTLGVMERMTITVYLAENQYGQVSVGDRAALKVDSYPGESFTAEVIRIADEAEYTPRNVQTEEERQTTVYAVALSVVDATGKLKPGMPVDVVFESREGG
jgi:HlyD family secretion protein